MTTEVRHFFIRGDTVVMYFIAESARFEGVRFSHLALRTRIQKNESHLIGEYDWLFRFP
jgi:hypothetical protein